MRSQATLAFDLSRLVDAITKVDGVLGIILFGSAAREQQDEYSDYDLLVLFRDEESLWSQWNSLYERVGELRLLVHVIPKTLREFRESTEPTFLDSVQKDGKILYLKYPLEAPTQILGLKQTTLIRFSMANLPQSKKMALTYRLYGKKKSSGILNLCAGRKVGPGCILVPTEHTTRILEVLREYRVDVKTYQLYTGL